MATPQYLSTNNIPFRKTGLPTSVYIFINTQRGKVKSMLPADWHHLEYLVYWKDRTSEDRCIFALDNGREERKSLRILWMKSDRGGGAARPLHPPAGEGLRGPALHPPAPGAAAPWNPALVCADNYLVGSTAATRLHGSNKRRCFTGLALNRIRNLRQLHIIDPAIKYIN